ncbi:hypothetical protein WBJ53_08405 [Spirosoma sp. SC4-14]|uniref:hypothetical protein n=1 Tax=Spirosoma sp. SC4-14 TaxID=3128900 RepID=UPI0030CE0E93
MKLLISVFLLSIGLWMESGLRPNLFHNNQADTAPTFIAFEKSLRFNIYTFQVTAADSGAVRDLSVKAYRGSLLLTNFHIRVDGTVVGAEVADLDNNRFPELYVYSASDGSGSFGRVYGWQFLPERKADIQAANWLEAGEGYMGHDSLWVERNILCRKFPIYNAGDANALPTGGAKMMRYRLQPAGQSFILIPEPSAGEAASR